MADHTEEMACSSYCGGDLNECSCFCGLPLCGPSMVASSEDGAELDDSCFLDGCQQHRFHFMCIGLWAKRSNTCPLCKAKIKGATRVRDGECASFEDRDVGSNLSDDEDDSYSSIDHENEWLDNVVCCVCDSGDSEDTLLLCDGRSTNSNCGSATHVVCAGLDYLPPMDQDWLCENCRNHRLSEEQESPPPCDSRSRRTIRSIHAATRHRHRRKTRCRVNRTMHSSGTRRLIRIMNAFEKRARKELRCGSRANYSASRSDRNILPNFCGLSSSSPRKRGGGQFSHGENYYLQRHSHPWTTKIEARLPMSNSSRVVESMLEEQNRGGRFLVTDMTTTAATESTEAALTALEKRTRNAAEQQRKNRGCSLPTHAATVASAEVEDILNAYQRDGKTYKRPRRRIVDRRQCDVSLKQMALLARECGAAASKNIYENALRMSSIGDVGSSHAIDVSLELAKLILIQVGVAQSTVKARRNTLEFLLSLEGVSKDHLMRSGIGRIITNQRQSDDGDLIDSLLTKWLSLAIV